LRLTTSHLDSAVLYDRLFQSIQSRIADEDTFAVLTITEGPVGVGSSAITALDGQTEGALSFPNWLELTREHVRELLESNRSDSRTIVAGDGTYTVFIACYVPLPRLIIVGATQTAQSLTRLSKELGFRVIVSDARATFATKERFPEADEVIKGWPQDVLPTLKMDEATYIVLLSHDPKFDEPTLDYVLKRPVRYIGAIGSKRTQQSRREKMRAQGFTEEQMNRVHGPVGLDLGGKAAEEVALSILAEMVAVRNGRGLNDEPMRGRSVRTSDS